MRSNPALARAAPSLMMAAPPSRRPRCCWDDEDVVDDGRGAPLWFHHKHQHHARRLGGPAAAASLLLLAATAILVPAQPSHASLAMRKEVREMTCAEWDAYAEAVNALRRSGAWDRLARVVEDDPDVWRIAHSDASGASLAFLPWHRAHLRRVERALQAVDPTVALPYWNWALDASDPLGSPVLSDAFFGSTGDPENGACVSDGAFGTARFHAAASSSGGERGRAPAEGWVGGPRAEASLELRSSLPPPDDGDGRPGDRDPIVGLCCFQRPNASSPSPSPSPSPSSAMEGGGREEEQEGQALLERTPTPEGGGGGGGSSNTTTDGDVGVLTAASPSPPPFTPPPPPLPLPSPGAGCIVRSLPLSAADAGGLPTLAGIKAGIDRYDR